MSNYKVEVKITGQLIGKGYFAALEGQEIQLKEDPEHVYTRVFDKLSIDEPLDFVTILRGWYTTTWTLEVKVNDAVKISQKGVFPKKGTVSIIKEIKLP